jgi:hypothetical protein
MHPTIRNVISKWNEHAYNKNNLLCLNNHRGKQPAMQPTIIRRISKCVFSTEKDVSSLLSVNARTRDCHFS